MKNNIWQSYQAGQARSILPPNFGYLATEPGRAYGRAIESFGQSLKEGFQDMQERRDREEDERKRRKERAKQERREMNALVAALDDGEEGTKDLLMAKGLGELRGLRERQDFLMKKASQDLAREDADRRKAAFDQEQAKLEATQKAFEAAVTTSLAYGPDVAMRDALMKHPDADPELLQRQLGAFNGANISALKVPDANYSAVFANGKFGGMVPTGESPREATGTISQELPDGTRVSYKAPLSEVQRMQASQQRPGTPNEQAAIDLQQRIEELKSDRARGGEYTGWDAVRGLGVQTSRSEKIKELEKQRDELAQKIEMEEQIRNAQPVRSQDEFDALPSGAVYLGSDGRPYRKP